MPEADDGAARRELEAKLSGLERLRLSGLVNDERYQAMRAKLLADAGELPPAAAVAQPIAPSAPQPPLRYSVAAPAQPPAETPAPESSAVGSGAAQAAPLGASLGAPQAAPPGVGLGTPPAAPPGPGPGAPPAAPPRGASSSLLRGPVLATIAAGVVLLAGAGFAAVTLAGHGSSQPTATGITTTSSNASETPTAAPTPDFGAFGQAYITDIAPLNKAWSDFDAALANAPAGAACGCPPGEFSVQSVLPAFNGLLRTYPQTVNTLQTIQEELTGQPAADCRDLIQDMQVTDTALQKLFVRGTAANLEAAEFNQVDAAQGNELAAATKLRIDLGLPMATPAP